LGSYNPSRTKRDRVAGLANTKSNRFHEYEPETARVARSRAKRSGEPPPGSAGTPRPTLAKPERYVTSLRLLKWVTPPIQRPRWLLKIALRTFGLKAERVQPIQLTNKGENADVILST
jgi:hypothetical protein